MADEFGTPPGYSFAQTVFREIDLIRAQAIRELSEIKVGIERAVEKLEKRDEERDAEVSELKMQVRLLRNECRRNFKRDAGLVLAPTTIATIVTAAVTAFMRPADPPPPMPRPPVAAAAPRAAELAPDPEPR